MKGGRDSKFIMKEGGEREAEIEKQWEGEGSRNEEGEAWEREVKKRRVDR